VRKLVYFSFSKSLEAQKSFFTIAITSGVWVSGTPQQGLKTRAQVSVLMLLLFGTVVTF